MKKPLEIKVVFTDEIDSVTGVKGYVVSNRPVISTFDGKTISLEEVKRDWLKELKSLLGMEVK